MELIRITHENLETEHICCAISNNKDVQVMSKKAWLSDRLDEGLVFLREMSEGNVLSNISRRNMHGYLLTQTAICSSTASGSRDSLRDTDILTCFWTSASGTARQKAKRGSRCCLQKRKWVFYPTLNICNIRAL